MSTNNKLPAARTAATNLRDYRELSIRATGLSEKSRNISALFQTEAAKNWNNYEQVLAQISDATSRNKIKPDFEKKHAEWMKTHRKNTEQTRYQYIRELQEILSQSRKIVELWKAPSMVATLDGIGSEARSRYLEQIKGLGPASLASLALKAELEQNRALASCLISVNDALPREKRFMSSVELAEKIWADDIKQAKKHHLQIDRAFQLALAQNRKCDGFGERRITKIEQSLKFKDVRTHEIPDIDAYDLGIGDAA